MLECVINISEGRDASLIARLASAAGRSLLDTHSDRFHNRSVFTLLGSSVYDDALSLTDMAFQLLDIREHEGVHPRGGVVDVVPFVPWEGSDISEAIQARQRFSREVSDAYAVPVFTYGPERTLPFVRREAFRRLAPDFGPREPHPRFGSLAVGARELLVAFNLYLRESNLSLAKEVARRVRSTYFRTLGLAVGDRVQVSANLVDPLSHGIYEFYLAVSSLADVSQGELVGLAPIKVIKECPEVLWKTLDVGIDSAIEMRASENSPDLEPNCPGD